MSLKIKKDGLSVEIKIWDFETMETEAIVNPTDGIFFGSGGLDGAIHERAGKELDLACRAFGKLEGGKTVVTEGYQLPVKKIVHVAVPSYKPENMKTMEQCYYSAIQAVSLGENMCRSMMIPLLGIGSRGWGPNESMRCAWKAILQYAEDMGAGYFGQDKLRKIIIACNQKTYDSVKVYRKNMGHLFLKTPEQWYHHGNLFLWEYLKWRLSKYEIVQAIPSAVGVLRIIAKIIVELTSKPLEKGETLYVMKNEEYGKLSGFPIQCDFWLDVAIPLLLENFCDHYEELGLPPMETIEILIGNHQWTIPKDCEYYFNSMRGEKNKVFVLKSIPAEKKKLALKEVGFQYSPAVENALKICFDAHKDQKDNSGLPYVFHPFHLAEQMETEDEICTALLHDVVEDSPYTIEDLKKAGFHETVTDAVALLTHNPDVPYMDYVRAIRKNKVARKVKMADLTHNSDPKRKVIETEWERRRAGKYRIAKAILEDDWYDHYMGHYRKTIPLDDKRLCFLSVFYDLDGIVKKYSLDVEAASDSHTEFGPEAIQIIKKKMGCKNSFPEALSDYFEDHSEWEFRMLLNKCKVKYDVFQYGD